MHGFVLQSPNWFRTSPVLSPKWFRTSSALGPRLGIDMVSRCGTMRFYFIIHLSLIKLKYDLWLPELPLVWRAIHFIYTMSKSLRDAKRWACNHSSNRLQFSRLRRSSTDLPKVTVTTLKHTLIFSGNC